MKLVIGLLAVLAVGLVAGPVVAADDSTFHALNQITVEQSATLTDAELATIEGQRANICLICVNYANVSQRNSNTQVNVVGIGQANYASQSNGAYVIQKIN
ncbi:MAG TPA: hypothetical protein VFA38_05265 [Nitrospirales bacterium]|nr:hypothetical protein [Nitrospirales bacterium]